MIDYRLSARLMNYHDYHASYSIVWSVIKSLWLAAHDFFLGLKRFCLAKTVVSLRAADQMWRENYVFFTRIPGWN